jgi:hypothetical protein
MLTLVVERTREPTTWLTITGWEATARERKILGAADPCERLTAIGARARPPRGSEGRQSPTRTLLSCAWLLRPRVARTVFKESVQRVHGVSPELILAVNSANCALNACIASGSLRIRVITATCPNRTSSAR